MPHEPDDDGPRHDRQHPGRGQRGPVHARGAHGAGHGGHDGLGVDAGERARHQQLDPAEHEAEEGRHTDPGLDQRQEDGDEEAREAVAVDVGRLVDLARDAAHEALEDPHRQRHVEHQVRQRHGDVGVHQADGGVELEERQQKHRRRCHAVGQQPEEHMFVAKKAVAREGIGRRQRDADRDDRVDGHVDQAVDVARIPGLVGEDGLVVGPGEVLRPQAEGGQDLLVRLEAHVHHPVDRQDGEHQVGDQEERALLESRAVHADTSFSPVPTRCIQL